MSNGYTKDAEKIRVKWIYKTKLTEHAAVDKFKARLVENGYLQEYGSTTMRYLHMLLG